MTNGQTTIYVGIDVSKDKLAVAIADGDVRDEVLSLGVFENAPASVEKLLKRLSGRASRLAVCYWILSVSHLFLSHLSEHCLKVRPAHFNAIMRVIGAGRFL